MLKTFSLLGLLGSLSLLVQESTASPVSGAHVRRDCSSRPSLNFTSCTSDTGLGSAFECGTLQVPIDHAHPRSANNSIDLWVSRRKANGTSGSLGTLFFNNGGPGSTTSYAWQLLAMGQPLFSQAILESYDIIAVDPRGIGLSTQLNCDADIWNAMPPTMVTSEAEFNTLVDYNHRLSESCEALTGPLFNFLDTESTVRDYELLRQALGVDKLNYIGFSYGTLQGQAYAELFPEHVGRFIWDAVVDHQIGGIGPLMAEATTYEATLHQFFLWCNATESCPLKGTDLPSIFANLTASDTAIPALSCNGQCKPVVSGENILFGVQGALHYVDTILGSWSGLASGLQAALAGDATAFSPSLQGTDAPFAGLAPYIGRATACQDLGSWLTSYADIKRVLDVTAHLAPLTKGASESFSIMAGCAGWKAPVRYPARRRDPTQMAKLPPVLLVNALYDPSTSAVWAEGVREQIPSSKLIWREGAGHTSYLLYGETSRAMDEFLLTGKLPADGQIYKS